MAVGGTYRFAVIGMTSLVVHAEMCMKYCITSQ